MKPLHPISASLTVLAGLVLSGAAMRGDQTPLATESAKPAAQVRLTKSDAAVFARDARKGVNVEIEGDYTVRCKAKSVGSEVNRIFKIPVLYLKMVRTKVHALGPYYFGKLLHVRNTT